MPTPVPRRSGPGSRSQGFTLLEAVVALAIFTGAAMSLYGLFNTNLSALGRVQDASRRIPAARQAIEHLSSINPRQEDAGSFEIGGFGVVWTARLLQPVRQSQNVIGARGDFEVGLYDVEFELSERGRPVGTWRLRVVGHEREREPGS